MKMSHPDWVPSVKLGTKDALLNDEKTKRDHHRFIRRQKIKKTATEEKESTQSRVAAEVVHDDLTSTVSYLIMFCS